MILQLPSREQQVLIRRAVNEDLTTRNQHLEAIKQWLKKQPHLPQVYDDLMLMNFLRGCSFSLEKCKKKIDMYYTMKTAVPEIFKNRSIHNPKIREILEYGYTMYLPNLTPDGKRIGISGTLRTDFETPDIEDYYKIISMVADIRLQAEEFGVAGDIYIFDASSAISKHFFKLSPTIIKKFMFCCQEAFPIKVKEVHVVNVTPFMDFLLNFLRQFMKEKLRKRIYIHQDFESLHQHVPKELLPDVFGGTGSKLEDLREEWLKLLEEHDEWFKEQDKIDVDESKRPGKQLNYDDLFGVQGSFKQLNVD